MLLQGVFLVFLPRNSKKILCTEHYIPITNPSSKWPLHVAPHSPSPQWAPGNPAPVPRSQLRDQAQATFTFFFILRLEESVCVSVPWGYCLQRLFPITSDRAGSVERRQVAIHQVPAAPFNFVQSLGLALLHEVPRDPQEPQQYQSMPFPAPSP